MRFFESLINYKNKGNISCHTPGHKNSFKTLHKDLFAIDFTELPETDNLFESCGPISNSENFASKLFKSKKSLFSAGGCTLCIQTMLALLKNSKKNKILSSRILHKSAINAMALLDFDPIFILPKNYSNSIWMGPILPEQIESELNKNSDIAAVYLTSPNYYGIMCDIDSIAKICKKYKTPLIIDNAHGSHLKFLKQDIHPLTLGADMTADSLHKTLPVLTGGAILHINNKDFCENAKMSMSIFGSTSPSFPILGSIDLCMDYLNTKVKEDFVLLEKNIANLKLIANQIGILPPIKNIICDPTRLTISPSLIGISANQAYTTFKKFNIEPEYVDENSVVLILTPMNKPADFFQIEKALLEFNANKKQLHISNNLQNPQISQRKISLKEAFFASSKKIEIQKSVGKICAKTIAPCPPGIPLILPGEIITKNIAKKIKDSSIYFISVIE